METAKLVLGSGKLLNDFVSRLLDDISNLKAMLRAISIGVLPLSFRPDVLLHIVHLLLCGDAPKQS